MTGIDLSHHNKITDWNKIKSDFCFLKCTQGINYLDPTFKERKEKVRQSGVILGIYHFADGDDPIVEADWFLKNAGKIKNEDLLALDWEIEHSNPVAWCFRFLERVREKTDIKPYLYTNEARILKYNWQAVANNGYKLWVAKYNQNNGQMGTLPQKGVWDVWTIWQYTSRGKIEGIEGNVDLNTFNQSNQNTMGKIISRRQGDPQWAKTEIDSSGINLAQAGCTITALSDVLHWYNADETPDVLAKTLSFTATGKIYWNSITEKTGAKFLYRYYNFDIITKKVVDAALKHPTKCVLLEFPFAGGRHWCWATGKDWLGRYKIADPLKGDFATSSRYGNPVGCTILDKK